MTLDGDRIRVDHIVACCNGCKRERTIWPDAELVGAEQIHEFIQRGIEPCGCGAQTADLALHIANPEVLKAVSK